MTHPNATPTLSTLQNSDPRFAVGHASPPKNDISLVLRSERDYEQAKSERAFLEEKYSEVSASDLDAFRLRMSELATAILSYEGKVTTSIKLIDDPLKYNTALFMFSDFKVFSTELFSDELRPFGLHIDSIRRKATT
ncbi:hypothetical protein, partial [Vibrio mediterranei]|uniref:hypothetical protein n=1 Tax=Vibrio mediterranei TaxID=689 RepID=UPI00148CE063